MSLIPISQPGNWQLRIYFDLPTQRLTDPYATSRLIQIPGEKPKYFLNRLN